MPSNFSLVTVIIIAAVFYFVGAKMPALANRVI